MIEVKIFIVVEWIVIKNVQIRKFFKKTNFMKLQSITLNVRMSKAWSLIGFKITELFEKPRDLYDDSKYILVRRMVVHRKSFNSFIVFDNRIESFFLEFLPVFTQFILIVVIKHEEKVLNVRNRLFEFKIAFCREQMICKFLQSSYTVFCCL